MSRKKDIDQLDCQILTELFKDSSITNRKLAEKLGLTPGPTLIRVNTLKKKGYISGFSINFNTYRLGLELYEITFTIPGKSKIPAVTEALSKMDFVMAMVGVENEFLITSHVYRISCLAPDEVEIENMLLELRKVEYVAIVDVKIIRTISNYKSGWDLNRSFFK